MPTADVQPTGLVVLKHKVSGAFRKDQRAVCGDNRDPSLRMLSGSHVHHHDALAGFRMVDVCAEPIHFQ